MLDENQSLRINFEGFVETVQVLLQANALYIKNENTRTTDQQKVTTAAIEAPVAVVSVKVKSSPAVRLVVFSGRRTSQKVFCRNISGSSNRKKDNPPLEIPTGSAARVRIT